MGKTVYIAWGFAIGFCILWLFSTYKLNISRELVQSQEAKINTLQTITPKTIEIELGKPHEHLIDGQTVIPKEIIKPLNPSGVAYVVFEEGERISYEAFTHFYRLILAKDE